VSGGSADRVAGAPTGPPGADLTIRSTCRSCSAGCGIVARVVDGELVDVRGDREHPLSHGYLCPKGRSLPWAQNRPERLDRPVVRGRAVSWDEALDDLAAELAGLIARHGGGCVGTFRGHGGHADKVGIGLLADLLTALGSDQRYSVSSIDIAPMLRVAQLVAGSPAALPRWIPEDPDSRLVLWLGGNPVVSHGYVTQLPDPVRRIKAFRERGGRLWVVDPRATRTAGFADHHLPIRPDADHHLLAWLVRQLLDAGVASPEFLDCTTAAERSRLDGALAGITTEGTVAATGLRQDQLTALLDAVRESGRIAVVTSTGITFQSHGVQTEWLRWVLLLLTDSLDRPGGMWFDRGWFAPFDLRDEPLPAPGETLPPPGSRPELTRLAGEVPVAAMGDEIRAGALRALFVNGGNPLSSFPDPAETERYLGELDVLVALDVAHSATTAVATHVLPVADQMERTDLLFWTDGYVRVAPAVVRPVGERKPLWWIVAQLGLRLGVDLTEGTDPDDLDDVEMVRRLLARGRTDLGDPLLAGPHGVRIPDVSGYMRERVLPGGRWDVLSTVLLDSWDGRTVPVASPFTLVSGRQLTRSCSTDLVPRERRRDRPTVALHRDDGARLGVSDGDSVRIVGEDGEISAEVALGADVGPGVVSIAHGWLAHNVSRLCSTTRRIDPLAGQPIMTALPVALYPLDTHEDEEQTR
jgi:anaerobic selenocysteine-containing dehydrogenase